MRFLPSLTALLVPALVACAPDPEVDPDISYLTDEERLELFDLERADYLLGMALKAFHEGIRHADEAALLAILADDFRATLVEPPAETSVERGVHRSGKLEPADTTDRDGFLAWARSLCTAFASIEAVSFARYHNSIEIIRGRGARAESIGAYRIAGISSSGGRLELSGSFRLVHDGFPRFAEDLAIEDQRVEMEHWMHELALDEGVFAASDGLLFQEVTDTCGVDNENLHDNWVTRVPTLILTGGIFLGDVNRDDHLDLLVTEILKPTPGMKDVGSTTRLYFGRGDGTFHDSGWRPAPPHVRFKNGTVQPFVPYASIFDATGNGKVDVLHAGLLWTWSKKAGEMIRLDNSPLPNGDATLGDYDRDGLVDLFFVNTGPEAPKERRKENVFFDDERTNGRGNQLFRNLGAGKFQDVTAASGASPEHGRAFAAVWLYANDDAWPDLFAANEFGKNVFLVNQGDGTFVEADDVDDVFGGFSMGVTSGDMDGDGRADLYVSNMYSKAGQRVYGHLDLDIYPEDARRMFLASVTGNRLYRSNGDLSFGDATAYTGGYAVGWGFSGAMFDVDLDGWLDVYAPCGYISVDPNKPDG